jgi:hypothetical protein
MSIEDLKNLGFKEISTYTIMGSLVYDLGRERFLSIGSVGTPNEMVFIGQKDDDMITDLVVIKNYDYDGYTSLQDIKDLIKLVKG